MENARLRLMAILAHPDDESLGIGGTLRKYASEGVDITLITATRGQRGRFGKASVSPGPDIVGQTRELELREAGKILGIREIVLLNYMDGDLDEVPPAKIVPEISAQIRRLRPQVVITFDNVGAYGHRDHIAISQFSAAALSRAADPGFISEHPPHLVSKFYWMAWSKTHRDTYEAAFKKMSRVVDGVERLPHPLPDWAITTWIDASEHWKEVYAAVKCHKTQIATFESLEILTEKQHRFIWGQQSFYRVMSQVNGGRHVERDLFAGLR